MAQHGVWQSIKKRVGFGFHHDVLLGVAFVMQNEITLYIPPFRKKLIP